MKTVFIVKESNENEKRVILLPENIIKLTKKYEVLVENNAGIGVNISNSEYEKNGARIVEKDEGWEKADLVLTYKGIGKNEYKYLKEGLVIAGLFHAEGNIELVKVLLQKKITAFSYEFIKDKDGHFPMSYPGGEIAGKLSVLYGAFFLQSIYGGSGKLLTAVRGVKKSKVGIIGYGNVGGAAIKLAKALGNDVVVFGRNVNKMGKISVFVDEDIKFVENTYENLVEELPTIDLLIGAILISTFDTEPIITEELMSLMKKGSVIIDVTCGYGPGYMPCIYEKTSLEEPIYINNYGIICCKIDNLPLGVPLTTTEAYSNNAEKWILKLCDHIFNNKFKQSIENGKIVEDGIIKHDVIEQHFEYYKGKNI